MRDIFVGLVLHSQLATSLFVLPCLISVIIIPYLVSFVKRFFKKSFTFLIIGLLLFDYLTLLFCTRCRYSRLSPLDTIIIPYSPTECNRQNAQNCGIRSVKNLFNLPIDKMCEIWYNG